MLEYPLKGVRIMALNFNDVFGKANVNISCPKCNRKFSIKLNQIGQTVTCPSCRASIELRDSDDSKRNIRNIDSSLKSLDKTLKNLGK